MTRTDLNHLPSTIALRQHQTPGKMWLHAYGLNLGELQWFAHPNSVAAALDKPPAYPKVTTRELSLLRSCAEDCLLGDRKCSSLRPSNIDAPSIPPLLPHRVIDIGDASSEHRLRLHDSAIDERAFYTTLSHRWGNVVMFKTTQKNIKDFHTYLNFNALPISFKDAVTVTKALGIRYLWIDAICIIQDDRSDWIKQAPLMGKIYKNAYCTIAAHSAQDSLDGFLESESAPNPVKVAPCQSTEGPGTLCIGIPRSFKETIDCSYINQRGWVLQELTLSQRIAHFSSGYIYWDCPHTNSPLSIGNTTEQSIQASRARKAPGTGANFSESWLDLVTNYSKCQLTYGKDKLVAISGIAAEWQSRLGEGPGGRYHSGVFECTLPQSLLWFSGGGLLKRVKRRAPSWSWASVDGHLQFMNTRRARAVATFKVERTVGKNGALTNSSRCLLTGHASITKGSITAERVHYGAEDYSAENFLRAGGAMITGFHLDIPGYSRRAQASIDDGSGNWKTTTVYCARVCTMQLEWEESVFQRDFLLILKPLHPASTRFKRIGVGSIFTPHWPHPAHWSAAQDFVIV